MIPKPPGAPARRHSVNDGQMLVKRDIPNKSLVKANAKGAELPAGPFPLGASVVVQAQKNDSGLCWKAASMRPT